MKKILLFCFMVLMFTAVSAQTRTTVFPFKAGDNAVEMRINPNDFKRDQVFDLREEASRVDLFKGDDFNVFVLVEGYTFRFYFDGWEVEGNNLLHKVLSRSFVIVVSENMHNYNVMFGTGGYILYPATNPDYGFPCLNMSYSIK